jgi:acetoin utilization deacetylase AcuC-like enzyme
MKVFTDPRVAEYEAPGHPEAPFRVARSARRLSEAGFRLLPPAVQAAESDVLKVHTPRHWEAVKSGDFDDPDTPRFPGMDRTALISLSGALSALDSALTGEPAFSLMRPPGHHAAAERVAGFCYINNMAAACQSARGKGLRTAVLDVDVHHGDGTESIAHGKEGWLFASIHQAPLYPGTGLACRDNCLNYPLPPFTDEAAYLPVLESALERIVEFSPDVLGVSAGFDTYKDCPLALFKLEKKTYRRMGKMIARTGLRRFAVLEGGYAEDLPVLIEEFLEGFGG